jgi:hypothetical protein
MDVEKVYNFERVKHDTDLVNLSDDSCEDGVCYLRLRGKLFCGIGLGALWKSHS